MWVLVVGDAAQYQAQSQLRNPWNDQLESKLRTLKANEPLHGGGSLGRILAAGSSEKSGVGGKQSPLPTSADLKRRPARRSSHGCHRPLVVTATAQLKSL